MQPVTYSAPRATTTRRRLLVAVAAGFALATLVVASAVLPGQLASRLAGTTDPVHASPACTGSFSTPIECPQ